MSTNKINSELSQIVGTTLDVVYSRRIEWANARGKRLEFIKELNKRLTEQGVSGKVRSNMYSSALVAFDKENMKMSWV